MQNHPAPTIADLAAALKLSARRIRQLRDAGMPTNSVPAALEWRKSNSPASCSDSAERLRLERIALVKEQRISREIENAKLRRELVSAGEVQQDIARVCSAARDQFLKLSNDLPPRLLGLSEAKMSVIIRAAVIDVLTRLSDETSELYQ